MTSATKTARPPEPLSERDPTQSGIFLIDADSTTYNAPKVVNIANTFFTIDTAVPIPAYRFGFYTPDEGYRSDGTPLRTDVIPAFDASIGGDAEPAVNWGGNDLFQRVVANVGTNFESDVRIDFSRQYARFFRWRRRESPVDAGAQPLFRAAVDKAIRPFHSKALSVGLISLRTACRSAPSI